MFASAACTLRGVALTCSRCRTTLARPLLSSPRAAQVEQQMANNNAGGVAPADAESATPILAWDTERHGVGMPDVAVRPSTRAGHSHLVVA